MKKLASVFIVLNLSFSVCAVPAKTESIKQLMEISGAEQMGNMIMSQMLPALKQSIPDAPDEFWQGISAEMNIGELIESIIPVYQKHLTEADIQSILQFYATPAGKKLISSQPLIMQESMQIGQQWGQSVFMKVMEKHANITKDAQK